MQNGLSSRSDPYQGFNFVIEMETMMGEPVPAAGFTECTGLEAETEVLDYREGGFNEAMHHFWGPTKYPPLVLKRGLTASDTLWSWCRQTWEGVIERRNISIVLRDAEGQEAQRWDFMGAFPTKWAGPELRADSGNVAFVAVTFSHRGLVPMSWGAEQ